MSLDGRLSHLPFNVIYVFQLSFLQGFACSTKYQSSNLTLVDTSHNVRTVLLIFIRSDTNRNPVGFAQDPMWGRVLTLGGGKHRLHIAAVWD